MYCDLKTWKLSNLQIFLIFEMLDDLSKEKPTADDKFQNFLKMFTLINVIMLLLKLLSFYRKWKRWAQ